jgi:hypothetical protein
MRPASLSVLAVLLLGCFVTAQSDQTQISDRVEVFGGYTYERPDFSLVNSNVSVRATHLVKPQSPC